MKNDTSTLHKVLYHPISKIILGTLAILTGIFLVKTLFTKPILSALGIPEGPDVIIGASVSTLAMIGAYFLWMRFYEKRSVPELSFKGSLKGLGIGFGIGFAVISLAVLILYLMGYYEIQEVNSLYAFLPSFAYIIGGVMLEELVFRGLMFRILREWKGTAIALIASSIVFQLPHFMNPHENFFSALLGVLFGLVCAILYVQSQKLWLPFAFHLGWNIAQPLWGTTLSGIEDFDLVIVAKLEGPRIWTGSAFGIEDSVLSMAALVILFLVYYRLVRRKGLWKGFREA